MAPAVYNVFYKYKSSKDFYSLCIDGPFISVSAFKAQIFASDRYGRGKDFDLLISHAETDEQYVDGSSLILANSSLLIRRVPGHPQFPILFAEEKDKPTNLENNPSSICVEEENQEEKGLDLYDFGPDFDSIPRNSIVNPSKTHCKEDKTDNGFNFLAVKGFRKNQIPPQGYVCHRCKVAGHYIQYCPTNGDPSFDFKTLKPATGISMASASTSTTSCASTVTSTSSSSGCVSENMLPPELSCPLCKKIMQNAVMTKCCFASFCDKCIKDQIVSKSVCVCQRKIVDADILPNMTLRDTINGILNQKNQSGNSGSDSAVTVSEASNRKRKQYEIQDLGEIEQKRMRKTVTGAGTQRCYNGAIKATASTTEIKFI